MSRHFGVAGCSRSKEHQCSFVPLRTIQRTLEFTREKRIFLIKVVPAVFSPADHNEFFNLRAFFSSAFSILIGIAVGSTYDCFNASGIISIFKVVFFKLVCCRDCHCTKFMERNHTEPKLIMAF